MTGATREPGPINVLFLSDGNDARSLMAEAVMNREGRGRFVGYSAGPHPKDALNPHAASVLTSVNYKVDALTPKSWELFREPGAPRMDFVFSLDEGIQPEADPPWPGDPLCALRAMPDPSAADGTPANLGLAYADVLRRITTRIELFLALPHALIDRLVLQERLNEIGRGKSQSHAGNRA